MNGAVDILKRERDEAVEQVRMLRARIRDVEAAIAVLEGQPAPVRAGRSSANIKQSVLSLLNDEGETGATPRELTEALMRMGHSTSEPSVSSTLSRLKGEAKVNNRGGKWFAASAVSAQAATQQPTAGSSEWDDFDHDVPL